MNTLLREFGHCMIPSGTFLYRGYKTDSLDQPMFFMTKFRFASSAPGGVTQVWQVQRKLCVIFMIDHLSQYSRAHTSIGKVYSSIFPEEVDHKYSDLDIKQYPTPLREKFMGKLSAEGVTGWFSSLEDNQEVEVCLFRPTEGDIKLIERLNPKSEKYFHDSMKSFELFPPQSFFIRTRKILTASHSEELSDNQIRKRYRTFHDNMLEECLHGNNDPHEREILEEMYHNLRIKLNI